MFSRKLVDPTVLACALFMVVDGGLAAYYVAFAAHRVGWASFGMVAAVMAVFHQARARSGPKQPPSQFMLRNKKPLAVAMGIAIVAIVVVSMLLKGTPYQTELLGLILALGNMFVASLDYGHLRKALSVQP